MTRTRGRSLLHVLAACLAAFALQQGAEAQWNSGNIIGTYQWLDGANWVGGIVTNTITTTSTATGDLVFQWSTGTTISNTITPGFSSSAIRNTQFMATTGTQTLTFLAGSGFKGNTWMNNSSSFTSSLVLDLQSGTINFDNSGSRNLAVDSRITGAGSLSGGVNGSVRLTNTSNNWGGDLVVLAPASGNTSNNVAISPGAEGFGGNLFVNGNFILASAGSYTFKNLSGTVAAANLWSGLNSGNISTMAVNSTVSSTYAGFIGNETLVRQSGDLSLRKTGSGTLTLTGLVNAYSGSTTISNGVLDIRGVANAGVTGTISGASGGTTGTIASTAGIQVGMQIFKLSNNLAGAAGYGGTVTAITSATTFTVSTPWTGNSAAGGNSVLFGFYSGLGISTTAATNLVIDGGSLRYAGGSGSTNRLFSIGTGGGGIIADGTTGQLLFTGGGTIGFNGQSGARVFTLSGTNTGTNTLTTALADNGGQTALIKSGLGRWVLGGSHAYTGTTRIDAGRLTIDAGASIGSSRTVVVGTAAGSGARLDVTDTAYTFTGGQTLMGSGTVAGGGVAPTTVTINGTLSPGNSPGLLTFDNTSLALGSTGNVIMEISGSTRGTQYDAIDITGGANGGGLTYGGTMTLNFTQTFTSGTFNLFKFDLNETSGAFSSVVFDPASQYTGSWGLVGDVWKVTTNDNTVMEFRKNVEDGGVSYGQLVIVPEPLTLGLLGIGSGIAVVGLRHLRRRKANGTNGTSTSDDTADKA